MQDRTALLIRTMLASRQAWLWVAVQSTDSKIQECAKREIARIDATKPDSTPED